MYEWVPTYATARAKVATAFDYSPRLLCAQATVHGRMTKHVPERPQHHLTEEHVKVHRAHMIPIRQHDVWYISHRHRFIYIRGHKAGSTSITKLFQRMFCGQVGVDKCDPHSLFRAKGSELAAIDERMYMDYLVFSFVRNPLARLASAYLHFASRLRNWEAAHKALGDREHPVCTAVPFSQFARDTFKFVRWCREQRCWPGKMTWRDSFQRYPEDDLDMHFNDQSHGSFRPDGLPVVDFIGRVETFDEDWAELLTVLSERNNHTYSTPSGGHHANTGIAASPPAHTARQYVNDCRADLYEALYNGTTAYDIALSYAPDFVQFGFALNAAGLAQSEQERR